MTAQPHPEAHATSRRGPARPTTSGPVPQDGLLAGALPQVDAGDAWLTPLAEADSRSVDAWHVALVSATPDWVTGLMALRNRVVALAGIATVPARADAGFPLLARADDEVLLGVDDVHLSFRVSLRIEAAVVRVSTIVHLHNRRGRAYWAVVRWFHPVVVRSLLRRVVQPVA